MEGSLEQHSRSWVGAFVGDQLVGFVHVVWDGGRHAFLIDTMIAPDFQYQRIGNQPGRGSYRRPTRTRYRVAPRRLRTTPQQLLSRHLRIPNHRRRPTTTETDTERHDSATNHDRSSLTNTIGTSPPPAGPESL
ncbi:GNAT family N-acetyltransferase [Nocardia gipuzkoensis]